MMNKHIQFSEENDADGIVRQCDKNIIPIFPVRFALTGDALIRMLNSADPNNRSVVGNPLKTPLPPKKIDDTPDHELVRIRKGYVYVYADGKVQVFRFETYDDDENASIYHPQTETQSRPAYSFTKYEFEGVDSRSKWKLLNESYPYLFVPKDTKQVWVAYSEMRWPYLYFSAMEEDSTLRAQMMTWVNLESRTGDFCAPLTELPKHVPAFRQGTVDYGIKDYSFENALRFTSVEIESPNSIIICDHAREKGVLVALHDPVGEIQDLLGLMSVHNMTQMNFLNEHQYPLVMGEAVQRYADAEKVAEKTWYNTLYDGELSDEFSDKYNELKDVAKKLEKEQLKLGHHWASMIARDMDGVDGPKHAQRGSFYWEIATCHEILAKYNVMKFNAIWAPTLNDGGYEDALKQNPKDLTELISYELFLWSRVMNSTAMSPVISSPLSDLFGDGNKSGTSIGISWSIKPLLKMAKSALKIGKECHQSFKPALNAVFAVYGTQIVESYGGRNGTAVTELVKTMFKKSIEFRKVDDLKNIYTEMLTKEGYPDTKFPDMADQRGNRAIGYTLMTDGKDAGKINVIEFHAQVDLEVSEEYLKHARHVKNFDLSINGFGLVAAGLSISSTIREWDATPLYASSGVGKIALDPRTKLIAAFADATQTAFNITKNIVERPDSAVVEQVFSRVFKNQAALSNAVSKNGSTVARAVSSKSLQLGAKSLGVVSIAMNAMYAYEGVQRGDSAMVVGNSLMAAGSLALLFVATGPIAVVALIAIAIGAGISMLEYDIHERWVKDGFWGTSTEYWGETRDTIHAQIVSAMALADPDARTHQIIKKEFEQELSTYVDINSELNVEDTSYNDNIIDIYCASLRTNDDLKRLHVEVTREVLWSDRPMEYEIQWYKPGSIMVKIPNPHKRGKITEQTITVSVKVDRLFYGETDGYFKKELTVNSKTLWARQK